MIIRSIFWLFVISLVLPAGSMDFAYGAIMRGTDSVVHDVSYDASTFDERSAGVVPKFCDDFPTVCSVASSGKRTLHVQAINLTGTLNQWLIQKLETEDQATEVEFVDNLNKNAEPA